MSTFLCTLVSSSSGNAVLAVSGETRLLVDAGLSLRRLRRALAEFDLTPDDLTAVLVTHEHSDHISGLPTLAAACEDLVIYASAGAAWALTAKCPALSGQVRGFRAGDAFDVGSVAVETFPTPHDTKDSVGYALALDGVRACVATDMGHVPDELLPRLAGCGYLLLESNHDVELLRNGGYPTHLKRRILGDWGHLSNQDAARTAVHCARTGTRHITLGHLSKENNRPELAYEVTYNALTAAGFCPGRDVMLDVAPAVGRSEVFAVVNSCGGGGQLRIIPLGAQAN